MVGGRGAGDDVEGGENLHEVAHETWSHVIAVETTGQLRCISGKDGDGKGGQVDRGRNRTR